MWPSRVKHTAADASGEHLLDMRCVAYMATGAAAARGRMTPKSSTDAVLATCALSFAHRSVCTARGLSGVHGGVRCAACAPLAHVHLACRFDAPMSLASRWPNKAVSGPCDNTSTPSVLSESGQSSEDRACREGVCGVSVESGRHAAAHCVKPTVRSHPLEIAVSAAVQIAPQSDPRSHARLSRVTGRRARAARRARQPARDR